MSKYQPRRAEPGQMFSYTDSEGRQVTLRADDQGVVTPSSAQEETVLNSFDLPVARKTEAAKKEK